MTWANDVSFSEPLEDLRADADAANYFHSELLREVRHGHVLYGTDLRVIARALPQDDVLVETVDGQVALVHLTFSGHAEAPPWPSTQLLDSAQQLQRATEFRY